MVQAQATLAIRTIAFKPQSIHACCTIPCQRRQRWSSSTCRTTSCISLIIGTFRRPCGSRFFATLCAALQSCTRSALSTQVSAILVLYQQTENDALTRLGQDIKPDNIMIDLREGKSPVVKITDLEDSVRLDPGYSMMGRGGGNFMWRSPESHCNGLVNTPSDIFSFGATVCTISC